MKNDVKMPESIDLSKMSRTELEDEFIKLYPRCSLAEARADRFLEEIRLAMQKRYGRSSEKGFTGQLSLFDTLDCGHSQADEKLPEDEKEIMELVDQAVGIKKKNDKSKGPIKKKDFANLEVRTVEFIKSPEEQICPECGNKLEFIKNIVRRELEVEKPRFYV